MISSMLDISGDLLSMTVWFLNGLLSGNPLYAWGSSF